VATWLLLHVARVARMQNAATSFKGHRISNNNSNNNYNNSSKFVNKIAKIKLVNLVRNLLGNLRQRCKQLADQLRVACHTGHRSLRLLLLLSLLWLPHILRFSCASFIT